MVFMIVAVTVALFSAMLFGVSSVIKKILLNNTPLNSFTFTVYSTLVHSILGLSLVLLFSVEFYRDPKILLLVLTAGLIYGISLYIYNYAIEKDEVSRATQLASLETVITPAFAILILGESVGQREAVGLFLVVLAILSLSIEKKIIETMKVAKYAVLPIFLALILWGIEDVILKYALNFRTVFFVYFWVRFSSFATLLMIGSIIPSARKNMVSFANRVKKRELELSESIYFIAPIISSIGLFLTVYAYSIVELSIASPLVGSYPIFSILTLYVIQKRYDVIEDKDEEPIRKRIISAILFVCGIIVVSTVS